MTDSVKLVYASDLAYVMALLLSKTSMMLLALRLSPERFHRIAAKASLGFCVLLILTSILMVGLGCGSMQPWDQQCYSMVRFSMRFRR